MTKFQRQAIPLYCIYIYIYILYSRQQAELDLVLRPEQDEEV